MSAPEHSPTLPPFHDIFREHARFVWRVLRRFGVAESERDDSCQEVFVVIHRQLPNFQGRSALRTWIYEIARRTALAQRRRQKKRNHEPLDDLPEPMDPGASPAQRAAAHEALRWLERALAELDDDRREAFVLHELEDMTLAEVAEALATPLNTIHSRIQSVRTALRVRAEREAHARSFPGDPSRAREYPR